MRARARSATTYSELIDALQGLAAGDKPSGADGLRLSVPSGLEVGAKALGDADRDLVYVPLTPCRIIDTRVSGQRMTGGSMLTVPLSGYAAAGAVGVVATLTAVDPARTGYLTAWPCGARMPWASVLNTTAGRNTPNGVHVRVDDPDVIRLREGLVRVDPAIVGQHHGVARLPALAQPRRDPLGLEPRVALEGVGALLDARRIAELPLAEHHQPRHHGQHGPQLADLVRIAAGDHLPPRSLLPLSHRPGPCAARRAGS